MPRGVRSTPVEGMQGSSPLAPDVFEEMYAGLPEVQREIRTDRIAGDRPATNAPAFLSEVPEDRVVVTNLRYPDEMILIPQKVAGQQGDTAQFTGQHRLHFQDSRLMCTQEQADFIKSVCPYVHIEPTDGPVLDFRATGFQTRSADVLSEYASRYAANL